MSPRTTPRLTLAEVGAPLLALRVLVSELPGLPAGTVRVSDIYPDRLDVTLYDDLSGFETWRATLGIDPEQVTCDTQAAGRTWVLTAAGEYAGVTVHLTGFADVPETGGAA